MNNCYKELLLRDATKTHPAGFVIRDPGQHSGVAEFLPVYEGQIRDLTFMGLGIWTCENGRLIKMHSV